MFLDLKCLKCRIFFFIKHFTRSVVYNIFVATYLLRPPSKHRQRCLAPAEREVVPPRVRGPLSPLFLGGTTPYVTFRVPPSRQRARSSRAYFCLEPRNLEPAPHHSFIMSAFIVPAPVDPSPPVYRHYYVRTGK